MTEGIGHSSQECGDADAAQGTVALRADTAAAVLRAAADLIEPEGRWTRGALARKANGAEIGYGGHFELATCYCASGAIHVACNWNNALANEAYQTLERSLGRIVIHWNDEPGRTQAQVVAALRKAAALAEREAVVPHAAQTEASDLG